MTTDQDWARDLFERSREGEEPVWVADHTAMIRSGRRRKRVRALTASGSVVLTAAVVAAVGIGVGGTVDRRTPDPSPGHGAPPTKTAADADPAKVLDYLSFGFSTKDDKAASRDYFGKYYIPVSTTAAHDSMQVLSKVDPTLTHFAKTSPTGGRTRLVPDDDPMVQDMARLGATALWTDSGMSAASLQDHQATAPTGLLNLAFIDAAVEGFGGDAACMSYGELPTDLLDPVRSSDGGWTDAAQWKPCVATPLPDGSTLMSSTKSSGPFVQISVIRKFPGTTGLMAMSWQNFPHAVPDSPAQDSHAQSSEPSQPAPDPKRALSPSPVTLDTLRAALSDTSLVPPLTPERVAPPPATMLQASDFGAGWTVDPAGSTGKTGDLVVDDGCVNTQNPVASPQPLYGYAGKTPSGLSVTATAQVDVMKAGSGPGWMTDLRQHGTGGCDRAGLRYSQDTMSALPSGIGDDAFIENWYGQGAETFFIRFGDSILRVDVTTANHEMPAFTQADKDWFAGLAAKAAARHGGKG